MRGLTFLSLPLFRTVLALVVHYTTNRFLQWVVFVPRQIGHEPDLALASRDGWQMA